MSDQPHGRKRIAGRRPTRPAGTPQADDLPTVSATTQAPPPALDEDAAPDETTTPDAGTAEPAAESAAGESADEEKEPYGRVVPPRTATRSGRVLVGVLAALLVVTLGVGGVLGVRAWNGHEKEQRRDAAAGAAAKAAALVLSYDYRKLPADFGAARQTLTPEFAEKFDQTTKLVGEQATKTKATVKAEVREVSVSNSSADVVNVLLFVNQTTSSTVTQGKPRVDLNRARFTMVRSDGRWLVQEVAGL